MCRTLITPAPAPRQLADNFTLRISARGRQLLAQPRLQIAVWCSASMSPDERARRCASDAALSCSAGPAAPPPIRADPGRSGLAAASPGQVDPLGGSRPAAAWQFAPGRGAAAPSRERRERGAAAMGVAQGGPIDDRVTEICSKVRRQGRLRPAGPALAAAIGAPDVPRVLQDFWRRSRQILKRTTIARTKSISENLLRNGGLRMPARSAASSWPLTKPDQGHAVQYVL